jgi:hypothetical protein
MNPETPRPPSDSELDRLLAGKLRRTSPEFEQRWRELRSELVGSRPRARAAWPRWLLWPGLTTLAVASLAVALVLRRAPAPAPAAPGPVTFEELIALDAALQPARSLLAAENRDALLHLPAQPRG